MFQVYFTDRDVFNYKDAKTADTGKFNLYLHKLLKKGVFIPPSQFECCFISLMHTKEDLEYTLGAAGEALKE